MYLVLFVVPYSFQSLIPVLLLGFCFGEITFGVRLLVKRIFLAKCKLDLILLNLLFTCQIPMNYSFTMKMKNSYSKGYSISSNKIVPLAISNIKVTHCSSKIVELFLKYEDNDSLLKYSSTIQIGSGGRVTPKKLTTFRLGLKFLFVELLGLVIFYFIRVASNLKSAVAFSFKRVKLCNCFTATVFSLQIALKTQPDEPTPIFFFRVISL